MEEMVMVSDRIPVTTTAVEVTEKIVYTVRNVMCVEGENQ
jgi:hypothetical protein